MGEEERQKLFAWYETHKSEEVSNYRRVLEKYCQDDVTFIRQACPVFRRDFMQIANINVFVESITIASACNNVLRKRFLLSDTIGPIPTGVHM